MDEIQKIKAYVPQALTAVPVLIIAESREGKPSGFMGISGQKLEMLFISNEFRRNGIGRSLMQYGNGKISFGEMAESMSNVFILT